MAIEIATDAKLVEEYLPHHKYHPLTILEGACGSVVG
jgi:hypothetical protein